jgi:hypothetical protein
MRKAGKVCPAVCEGLRGRRARGHFRKAIFMAGLKPRRSGGSLPDGEFASVFAIEERSLVAGVMAEVLEKLPF